MNERIDAFLRYLAAERGLTANTVSAYHNDLVQFGEFLQVEASRLGATGLPLSVVDRERLGGYLLSLRERGYAPATVARKLASLKSFFQYLKRVGEVASDPTEGLEAPEVKKATPRAISAEDVRLLVEQAQQRATPEALRDAAMLRILYATGMRVSEMVALDVADASFEDGTVRITGRGGRTRVVPVDGSTLRGVRTYLQQAREHLVRHDPSQPALFVNHRGQRLTRQGFWLIMKALVRDAGLSVLVTPHTLRHSFATQRVGEGVSLPQLQQLLGHASLSTTQMYARPSAHPGAMPAALAGRATGSDGFEPALLRATGLS